MKMNVIIISCIWILSVIPLSAQNPVPYGNNPSAGRFTRINGISIYCEIYGNGHPLVLLHGNGGSITSRQNMLTALAQKYKVIAIDSRCHGNSGCGGELNYELMAADVNALLDSLHVDSAYIWGHSDGGIIGLIMGYTYPAKVKRLIASGANITPDTSALEPLIVELMQHYSQVPDSMMQKRLKLMVYHPHIDARLLQTIAAPVLLVTGDRDAVRLEHTIKIFQSIPNSNLCVLPASTHFIADEKPNLILYWLNEFFTKDFSKPSTVEWAQKMAKQLRIDIYK